jgi:hypothetical protein
MISLSPAMQQLMEQDIVNTFYLVKIYTDPPALLTSYGDAPLQTTTGETFINEGYLLSVDPPALSTTVDRAEFKVVLANNTFEASEFFDSVKFAGARLEVYLSAVTESGYPINDIDQMLMTYGGRISGITKEFDTNVEGESKITILCTSPVGKLDAKSSVYTSKEYLRNIVPNDSAFDQVYIGSGRLALRWGKN